MKETFKLALAQISCKRGNKAQNLKKIEETVIAARGQGAELVIFPELAVTGYTIRDQSYELAETIPGASTITLAKIAKRTRTHIVFGLPELSEKTQATIYNSAVMVGPKGLIGKYRKMYLPTHSVFEEKRYFRPGYEAAAFDTDLGRIGLMVCYDVFFPEVSRLVRLQGARLIVCISASPAIRRVYFETLTTARAIENTTFFAYVNLVGIEDGLQFCGGSRLIGPQGKLLAKATSDDEDLVIGEVDYADMRSVETFVPTLRDLRPELFDKLKEGAEKL
jgi:predicted amidohydrolase